MENLRVLVEQGYHGGGKQPDNACRAENDACGQGQSCVGALLGSPDIFCADVLTYKCGGRLGHTLKRQENKLVNFCVAAPSGHAGGAEAVNIGLNINIGKRSNGLLKSCGKPHNENLLQHGFINADIFPHKTVIFPGSGKDEQNQKGRNELGQDGCIGNAGNSKPEGDYK